MASPTRARGKLPARVYWFRRGLVLATAIGLVVFVAQLLGGGGSPAPGQQASVTAARTTPTAAPTVPLGPAAGTVPRATGTPAVLAQPDGPCSAADLIATPAAAGARAGQPVTLTLALTGIRPACTFAVSSQTLAARITRGQTRIWSSQDCPASVPKSTVVVRSAVPTTITITWNGRRSNGQCSNLTPWALPATYHLEAAVIGSEPTEVVFSLGSPPRPVVTRTVHPKPVPVKPTVTPKAGASASPVD